MYEDQTLQGEYRTRTGAGAAIGPQFPSGPGDI